MKRKKGDLPGRYVAPHIRKWPNRSRDYVNVAAYQEQVDPIPAKTDIQLAGTIGGGPAYDLTSNVAKFDPIVTQQD
jgi:hypothetical protein